MKEPLRRLGNVIGNVPGLSVFAGPLGWVLTGLLLLAVLMVAAALLVGRRPAREPGNKAEAEESVDAP